jgi:hypothetical protein
VPQVYKTGLLEVEMMPEFVVHRTRCAKDLASVQITVTRVIDSGAATKEFESNLVERAFGEHGQNTDKMKKAPDGGALTY